MICLQEVSIWPPFWPPISLHWGCWGRWRPNAECICIINSLDKFVVSKARVWYPTWHTFWKFNFTPFLPAPLPPGPPQKVGLESTKWKILLGASISTQTIQHIPNSANSDNPVNAQLLFYRPLCNFFLNFRWRQKLVQLPRRPVTCRWKPCLWRPRWRESSPTPPSPASRPASWPTCSPQT